MNAATQPLYCETCYGAGVVIQTPYGLAVPYQEDMEPCQKCEGRGVQLCGECGEPATRIESGELVCEACATGGAQ